MKKWFILLAIMFSLCMCIYFMYCEIKTLNDRLAIAESNTKALLLENSELDSTSRTLKLTIEQLEYSKDSISKSLIRTINDNNINKKKISQLQYMLSTNFKVDTLIFKDTLFVDRMNLDTTITDNKWYKLDLALKYPNLIVTKPEFRNEYTIVFSYKKETIDPPKRFFLCRWFQKKHYITETKVFNNNPYSSVDTTRFIEIIKR